MQTRSSKRFVRVNTHTSLKRNASLRAPLETMLYKAFCAGRIYLTTKQFTRILKKLDKAGVLYVRKQHLRSTPALQGRVIERDLQRLNKQELQVRVLTLLRKQYAKHIKR